MKSRKSAVAELLSATAILYFAENSNGILLTYTVYMCRLVEIIDSSSTTFGLMEGF